MAFMCVLHSVKWMNTEQLEKREINSNDKTGNFLQFFVFVSINIYYYSSSFSV